MLGIKERKNNFNIKSKQTRKFESLNKSQINHATFCLMLIKDKRLALRYMKKSDYDTLANHEGILRMIAKGKNRYATKTFRSNGSLDHVSFCFLNSGLSDDPAQQANLSKKRMSHLQSVVDLVYAANKYKKNDLHFSLLTLTTLNGNKGQLFRDLRGKRHKTGNGNVHYVDNLGTRVTSYMRTVANNYNVLGTIKSFELVVSPEKIKNEDGSSCYHYHYHILVMSTEKFGSKGKSIPVKSNDGNVRYVNQDLYDRWRDINAKHGVKTAPQGFDCRPIYSKDGTMASAIDEATKYVYKPQLLNDLDTGSKFCKEIFAEVRGATKGMQKKTNTGDFNSNSSLINKLGKLKAAITNFLNVSPQFNASGKIKLSSIMTLKGRLSHFEPKNKKGYLSINAVQKMSYRQILYFNSSVLSNVIFKPKTVHFIRDAASKLNQGKIVSSAKPYFESILRLLSNAPMIDNVEDYLDVIREVKNDTFKKAYSFRKSDSSKYKKLMTKGEDLYKLVDAIKYYSDDDGKLNLNFHTSPTFGDKMNKWRMAFLTSLDGSTDDSKAWAVLANIKNNAPYSSGVDGYSDKLYQNVCRAIDDADSLFSDYNPTPQPLNKWSRKLGCFFDFATGSVLGPLHYDYLSAKKNDEVNYDTSGKRWNIDMFDNVQSGHYVIKQLVHAFKSFLPKDTYKELEEKYIKKPVHRSMNNLKHELSLS